MGGWRALNTVLYRSRAPWPRAESWLRKQEGSLCDVVGSMVSVLSMLILFLPGASFFFFPNICKASTDWLSFFYLSTGHSLPLFKWIFPSTEIVCWSRKGQDEIKKQKKREKLKSAVVQRRVTVYRFLSLCTTSLSSSHISVFMLLHTHIFFLCMRLVYSVCRLQ